MELNKLTVKRSSLDVSGVNFTAPADASSRITPNTGTSTKQPRASHEKLEPLMRDHEKLEPLMRSLIKRHHLRRWALY